MKTSISIDEAIQYLNELVALDKPAIAALVANRVPCNKALAEHPTAQVSLQNGGFHIGLLGVLNGLFGVDDAGSGPIAFAFKDGDFIQFIGTKAEEGEPSA